MANKLPEENIIHIENLCKKFKEGIPTTGTGFGTSIGTRFKLDFLIEAIKEFPSITKEDLVESLIKIIKEDKEWQDHYGHQLLTKNEKLFIDKVEAQRTIRIKQRIMEAKTRQKEERFSLKEESKSYYRREN